MAPQSALWCRGTRLVVESSRQLPAKGEGSPSYWLARFAGVFDRDAAEALAGAELEAEALPIQGEGLWVHELIGSAVFGAAGEPRGRVEAVEANPASDLLVLDSGALVPLRFVVSAGEGRVVVDVPEGLFDL
jgi:16S rRNA processing protein RimM